MHFHITSEFFFAPALAKMSAGGDCVMKDTFNDKSYSDAVKIAHLRFAVIAPVIQGLSH